MMCHNSNKARAAIYRAAASVFEAVDKIGEANTLEEGRRTDKTYYALWNLWRELGELENYRVPD